ncbi:xanthine dehydrogenase family protein molybdopterin-binding subunit [Rhizobium johnstonii]|uniref:xanthine dehydrogenase family protein molybdopterin-binding subunit n=1 Tax=Rhizobium TaxID=379 RepID=UPI0013B74A9D|nr:xanthine dehydrogenase family protein molybdopterin-binding subunit [Rhizobium leguminosarum]WSG93658.1 xanthine dehydrogenase family protein molybdopterin-binding subunit [Rhizobium johnstonii]MBB4504104.1 isoquinoline 1-oxidoreductase beta subunit [Rhizobium leguminosarum]MBY5422732.1 xanthine dehydrogenase family protein molybdopterin-binding subunit [Rhizobium leguminosarum]NEH96234.1 molybdopterin-dependent oxidoreductase [Rhizobium leguminosarum]NEI59734.1 molybdopterin-dependent oxid
MLPNMDYSELPRALQHMLERGRSTPVQALPRRSFLKLTGTLGLAVGIFPHLAAAQPTDAGEAPIALKPTEQPSAFVQIAPNGEVMVTINRLEFGQGVQTALPMILAEELDADWNLVRSQLGTNDMAYVDPLFGMHLTGGSNTIKNSFTQYRELGARVRAMLLAAAADRWNVDVSALRTEAGVVLAPDGRKLGYGELSEAAMALPVPQKIALKDPKDFRIIGQPTQRLDAQAKSSGQQSFGIDFKLPGQLTAVVARPPVFGAKIASLDDSAARSVKGVKAVLRVLLDRGAEGVAVVADGYWQASQGRNALKVEWDTSAVEKVDSEKQLAQFREIANRPGPRQFDADMAPLETAPLSLEAEFVFPYLAHAAMEPLNCTVRLSDDRAEIWMGSQSAGLDAGVAANVLGLKPEQVVVNVQTSGGGFGRRFSSSSDTAMEACQIAKAARSAGLNAPVRTLWSREDDMRGGYYRPTHLHRARIGFDKEGNVLAWDHTIVGQSILTGTVFEKFQVKDGIDAATTEGMRSPYPLPMRLTVHHPVANVPVLWWRSVGSTHTAFVMETLLDDIARATDQDPVAYRMKMFGNEHPRHRDALQLAVDKSGYGSRTLAEGRAWGVAVHESFSSVVAYVVEASVVDGQPKLHRVTAGVHCNLAVNPRTVEAQVQGAAIMGLSTCLAGAEITLKDGIVEQGNFSEFTVARITDVPEFDVNIVPSADAPTGMGEPGLPPLAPAFANAISRLTGKPVRQMPFNLT